MTSKRIAQSDRQQKSEKPQESGILQRAAVRSDSDAGMQSTEDQEALALSNSAFSKDFSQVPISTTKPQQFHARNLQSHPMPPIQAKLTIGEPNDRYEQEADRVASEVVQRINALTSAGQSVQRQEEAEEEIQAKPEITSLQRRSKPEAELQAKLTLQRREEIAGGEASPDLESTINRARGGGQRLETGLQQSIGQAMGADFSGVRVHTDAQSDQLNKLIQAKAFTTGQDVFFRQGEYNPGSRGGQELIAHELTHVVQQSGGTVQRSLFYYPHQSSEEATSGRGREPKELHQDDKQKKQKYPVLCDNVEIEPGQRNTNPIQRVVVVSKAIEKSKVWKELQEDMEAKPIINSINKIKKNTAWIDDGLTGPYYAEYIEKEGGKKKLGDVKVCIPTSDNIEQIRKGANYKLEENNADNTKELDRAKTIAYHELGHAYHMLLKNDGGTLEIWHVVSRGGTEIIEERIPREEALNVGFRDNNELGITHQYYEVEGNQIQGNWRRGDNITGQIQVKITSRTYTENSYRDRKVKSLRIGYLT